MEVGSPVDGWVLGYVSEDGSKAFKALLSDSLTPVILYGGRGHIFWGGWFHSSYMYGN